MSVVRVHRDIRGDDSVDQSAGGENDVDRVVGSRTAVYECEGLCGGA